MKYIDVIWEKGRDWEVFAVSNPHEEDLRCQMRNRLEGEGVNNWNSIRRSTTLLAASLRDPQSSIASYFSVHQIDPWVAGALFSRINRVRSRDRGE